MSNRSPKKPTPRRPQKRVAQTNRPATPPPTVATTESSPAAESAPETTKRLLLLWDAPNMDMSISNLLGTKPAQEQRPDFFALGAWLAQRAAAASAVGNMPWTVEGVVFCNVHPNSADRLRPWVLAVRHAGFAVFAKPKVGDSDIDDDIVAAMNQARDCGDLGEVIVASGDRRAFQAPLLELAEQGIIGTYLGLREFSGSQTDLPFVDLGDIPDLFAKPLPRADLANLPDDGALLPPMGIIGQSRKPR